MKLAKEREDNMILLREMLIDENVEIPKLYSPQFEQIEWGNLGSLHSGQRYPLILDNPLWDLLFPLLARVCFFLGKAVNIFHFLK